MNPIIESKGNCSFADIGEVVGSHQRFVVLSHVRPDGDAIGSQLAIASCLRQLGKDVLILTEDGVPESLAFLPGAEAIQVPLGVEVDAEVVIAVDTASQPRVGPQVIEAVAKVPLWINIDHHISNPRYGDVNYIDPTAPATGEILYELFEALSWPIDEGIAENLFAAISTDTGSFQYPSTTERTYRIAAELIRHGVRVGELSQKLYENFPLRRVHLMCEMLNVLEISAGGRVANWYMTQEMAKRLQLQTDDTEGLIDTIRAIDSVVVAVFFEELEDGNVRVSCRSKSTQIDVGKICGAFGGGGHSLAAGARMAGPIKEAKTKFLTSVYDAIEANG